MTIVLLDNGRYGTVVRGFMAYGEQCLSLRMWKGYPLSVPARCVVAVWRVTP